MLSSSDSELNGDGKPPEDSSSHDEGGELQTPKSGPLWPFRLHPLRHPIVLGLVALFILISLGLEMAKKSEVSKDVHVGYDGDRLLVLKTRASELSGFEGADAAGLTGTWSLADIRHLKTEIRKGPRFADVTAFGDGKLAIVDKTQVEEFDLSQPESAATRSDKSFGRLEVVPLAATFGARGLRVLALQDENLVLVEPSLGGWSPRIISKLLATASIEAFYLSKTAPVTEVLWVEKSDSDASSTKSERTLRGIALEGALVRPLFPDHSLSGSHSVLALYRGENSDSGRISVGCFTAPKDELVLQIFDGEQGQALMRRDSVIRAHDPLPTVELQHLGAGRYLALNADESILIEVDTSSDSELVRLDRFDSLKQSFAIGALLLLLIHGPAIVALLAGFVESLQGPGLPAGVVAVLPATIWRRVLALGIDMGLALAVAIVLFLPFASGRATLHELFLADPAADAALRLNQIEDGVYGYLVVTHLILMIVGAWCEWKYRVTPGKKVLRIQVSMEDGRSELSFWRALGRRALLTIDLGFCTAFFLLLGPKRQRLGDIVTRTAITASLS
ncbi:MAG: RDD family protein [Planctomycetota bacterium]